MIPRWLHQPYEPFAYAVSTTKARLVIQVEPGDVCEVWVHYGDRYQPHLTERTQMRYSGFGSGMGHYTAEVTIATHRLKYAFQFVMANGDILYAGERGLHPSMEADNVFQLAYLCDRDVFVTPDWVQRAVCMQIFPDRFARGQDPASAKSFDAWDSQPTPASVLGGDLVGITQRLPYLHDLGMNLIYLTPIFQSPSNHKYDTENYFQIDTQFGTKEDLKTLVEHAHKLGIRILLDAVFNHAGSRFPPFRDVLANGRKSRYWDWFFIDGDEVCVQPPNYETFANLVSTMPKLNVANPEVEAFLLDVAEYWIREFQIDGWRLDVANEIDHVFWRKFRARVKAVKRDALILGEVWHNSLPWLRGDEFDGVMNYPLREMILKFCVHRTMDAASFADALVTLQHQYPQPATLAMLNLLGSHDTPRVRTLADDDTAVMLALVLQFTLPGIPMVYYGDEVGMEGGADPDCRRGMDWTRAQENVVFQQMTRSLAKLKQSLTALGSTNLEIVHAQGRAIEYRRWNGPDEVIHVAVNDGDDAMELSGQGEVLFASMLNALAGRTLQPGCAVIWRP